MKKVTLVTRAIAFLKGGDEAKLTRFESKLEKYFKSQIDICNKEIEILNDKLTDAKEELSDYIPNIDIDRIGKADGLESYVKDYVGGLNNLQNVIQELENKIESKKDEIERFNTLQGLVYSEEV